MSKLPILMYHNITTDNHNVGKLTIHRDLLEKQFHYLQKKGFRTHFLKDLDNTNNLSGKNIVITFDDVTKNQLDYAIPLLKKYNLKATFFIPFAYIGKFDSWNDDQEPIMDIQDLIEISHDFELAFHSYYHRPYSELSVNEINHDFELCHNVVKEHQLKLHFSVAYPYGNFPKKDPEKSLFFETLKENKMQYGFRIGNRVNHYPFKNPYEINRLDIKGNKSLINFIYKIKYGKLF